MKQKAILIIALVALVSLMINPVSAETLTGTLGGGGRIGYSDYQVSGGASVSAVELSNISFTAIENTVGLDAIILFTNETLGYMFEYTNATATGVATPFTLKIGSDEIGRGTLGFSRSFSSVPPYNELWGGYIWAVFTDYDPLSYTGTQYAYLDYDHAALYNVSSKARVGVTSGAAFGAELAGHFSFAGDRIYYINTQFANDYIAVKPSGLGITGNISKGGYFSQVFVVDGTTEIAYTSDSSVNSGDFAFNVPAESIIIQVKTGTGTWYNSSILFAPTAPTITPTPGPTVVPGYVRNTFVTIDGTTYSTIHGSNIMLYDVEAGVWSNSTSDADGSFYIDTLPYHTINAYATFTVFEDHYADASIMGAETGYSGMDFPIYMYPPGLSPGPGNINLYITVVDADTTYAIGSANVQVELPTGAIDGTTTGSGGSAATFVVPNNTVIKARATKSGYGAVTESFNSGETSPKTKTLSMRKLLVTIAPTSTIPPGGVTPAITVIPGCEDPNSAGCSRAQDAAMMKQLRDAGPSLIGLCIIVMFMGLVKMLGK